MTVFTSRVRAAYLRRRSKKEMALIVMGIFVVMALYSVCQVRDARDRRAMTGLSTPENRAEVVSRWGEDAAVLRMYGLDK